MTSVLPPAGCASADELVPPIRAARDNATTASDRDRLMSPSFLHDDDGVRPSRAPRTADAGGAPGMSAPRAHRKTGGSTCHVGGFPDTVAQAPLYARIIPHA